MELVLDSLRELSDEAVVQRVKECVAGERRATAHLLASLGELDARRLFREQGFNSLFTYCVHHLHLSERAAYSRIEAARLARRFPIVLRLIGDSSVSLTAVALLARHLTESNHQTVLHEATFKTVAEVEVIVARLKPRPDVVSLVRRVPQPSAAVVAMEGVRPTLADSAIAPASPPILIPPRAVIEPLAPERFKVQVTISREAHDVLRRVQGMLRHSIPNGDPALIFERALSVLLADLEKRKLGRVEHPREASKRQQLPQSRHIPAAVRREVSSRDGGRCAFVGTTGRCRETGGLEFHHVVPFAAGGPTTVENIQLRCRAHNAHEAEQYFGPQKE